MTGASRTTKPILVFLALLAVSRLFILSRTPPIRDACHHYGPTALEFESAARAGLTVYESRGQRVRADIERASAEGRSLEGVQEYRRMEYPPLALLAMRQPLLVLRAIGSLPASYDEAIESYYQVYRLMMGGAELILVAAMLGLLVRLFPAETENDQAYRLLVYLASSLALWPLWYDRLDLVQAMLVELALVLLLTRFHYVWSFAVLAVAIHFKLMPMVLAPVFLIGSLPEDVRSTLSRRTIRTLGGRVLVLVGLVLGLFVPIYLTYGAASLGFLAYHRERGLEIHSLYATFQLVLGRLGYPVQIYFAHNCFNVRSPMSNTLVTLAPLVMGSLLLAVTLLCWSHFQRLAAHDDGNPRGRTFAQRHPREFVAYVLLVLLLSAVTNKVLSPQYLLWLVPLAPLVSFRPRERRLFLGTFVIACVLTTTLFANLLFSELAHRSPEGAFGIPTLRSVVLLVIRNLLLLALPSGLWLHLWRERKELAQRPTRRDDDPVGRVQHAGGAHRRVAHALL